MNNYDAQLPEEILKLVTDTRQQIDEPLWSLVRSGGYVAPSMDIMIDAIVAISMGKNVLLKGPTGSGKTKFAETLSHIFQHPMYSINVSVDLDAESLMGFKTLAYQDEQQTIQFIPGPVTKAMKNGAFLYIDEINMARPETLPLINGVLDYRRSVTNPLTNELIVAKKGFNVIAAINEGYIGTVPLNEALKNRFIVIEVPYLQGDKLKQLILSETKLTDERKADLFVQLSADLVTAVEQGKLSEEAASIRTLLDACDLSTLIPVNRAITRSIAHKLEEQREQDLVLNIAETLF